MAEEELEDEELEEELGRLDTASASAMGTACHMLLEQALKVGLQPESAVGTVVQVVTKNDGTEHARLAPSSAERWSACPGSVVLVPKMVESAPRSVDVLVTEEMAGWVRQVWTWVIEYLMANPGCVLYSEERARAGVPFGCPDDMWGTADVVIVNRRRLELVVADAKFGFQEVQAAGNKQLRTYAFGLAHDFGWAFLDYRLVILQPRMVTSPVKEELLPEAVLREELERARPKVALALQQWENAARGLPLVLVPTDEGCQWCEAKGACPAFQQRSLELARREFLEPELLPRSELVELLKAAPRVRDALNAAESHAARLIALGQPVPGFKLVRGVKRRVWVDEKGAADALQALGVPAEKVWKSEMQFTPAQAEKKLGAHFADMLEPYWEKPLGESRLAPEEDPRPPLPPEFEPC